MRWRDTLASCGGAFRCCLQTFEHVVIEDPGRELHIGDVIPCDHCSYGMKLIETDGYRIWRARMGEDE